MTAPPEQKGSHGDGARGALTVLRSLRATLMGVGPLDRRLMVTAPDLWLLRPATSPLWGVVGVLCILICWVCIRRQYAWVFPLMALTTLWAISVCATVARQASYGYWLMSYRPWYFRYRPLLITCLPLSAFLPACLLVLVTGLWRAIPNEPGISPAAVLFWTLLTASSFGSLLELSIRLGDHPMSQLVVPCLSLIVYFYGLIFAIVSLGLLPPGIAVWGGIESPVMLVLIWAIELILVGIGLWRWARWPPSILFQKQAVAWILLASSVFLPGLLLLAFWASDRATLGYVVAALASFAFPLITFRVLEPWIDRLAFAPPEIKATQEPWWRITGPGRGGMFFRR